MFLFSGRRPGADERERGPGRGSGRGGGWRDASGSDAVPRVRGRPYALIVGEKSDSQGELQVTHELPSAVQAVRATEHS